MAAVFGGLLLGVPLVVLQAGAAVGTDAAPHPSVDTSGHVREAARVHQSVPRWELVRYHSAATTTSTAPSAPTTTTSTAPPTTTTTVAPTTTTTEPPPTTTTTEPPPPPTTTTTAPPAPTASEVGEATWYAAAPPGMCASPTLEFGTVLTVTNDSTGASTRCTVDDREGDNPGRVVDLSYSGFSEIASPSQGVVTVTISW